jgi:hypothetical protein
MLEYIVQKKSKKKNLFETIKWRERFLYYLFVTSAVRDTDDHTNLSHHVKGHKVNFKNDNKLNFEKNVNNSTFN